MSGDTGAFLMVRWLSYTTLRFGMDHEVSKSRGHRQCVFDRVEFRFSSSPRTS